MCLRWSHRQVFKKWDIIQKYDDITCLYPITSDCKWPQTHLAMYACNYTYDQLLDFLD